MQYLYPHTLLLGSDVQLRITGDGTTFYTLKFFLKKAPQRILLSCEAAHKPLCVQGVSVVRPRPCLRGTAAPHESRAVHAFLGPMFSNMTQKRCYGFCSEAKLANRNMCIAVGTSGIHGWVFNG